MRFQRNKITTASTIVGTQVELSAENFVNQKRVVQQITAEGNNRVESNVPILQEIIIENNRNIQQTFEYQTQTQYLPKKIYKSSFIQENKCSIKIISSLQNVFFKKKRYTFQILKQFFLFPDDSQSSIMDLSTYDPLIFQDELIHSLVKKLETKIIENKIWAFLNLKLRSYLKAAMKIEKTSANFFQRTSKLQKRSSFEMIKKVSLDLISSIYKENRCFQINSNLSIENNEIQNFVDDKEKRKISLSSELIKEKVEPSLQKNQRNIPQSTTRIYTREEYEMKYGLDSSNEENLRPKIIRIQASNDVKKESLPISQVRIHQYQMKNTHYVSPVVSSQKISQKQILHKQSTQKSNGFNKFNIIHYHERPRQIIHAINKIQSHSQISNNCSMLSQICCCCHHNQQFCLYSSKYYDNCELNSHCCTNSSPNALNFKDKSQNFNQTAITQKAKSFKCIKSYHQSNYALSQLESRIQYLTFLRKVVKQQQEQQAVK